METSYKRQEEHYGKDGRKQRTFRNALAGDSTGGRHMQVIKYEDIAKDAEQCRKLPSRRRLTQTREWSPDKIAFFLKRAVLVPELLERIGVTFGPSVYYHDDGIAYDGWGSDAKPVPGWPRREEYTRGEEYPRGEKRD